MPKLRNEPKHKPPNPNEINPSWPAAASPAPKRTQITDGLRTGSQNLSQRPVDRHFGCGCAFCALLRGRRSAFTLHASTRQPFHPKMPAKHRTTQNHTLKHVKPRWGGAALRSPIFSLRSPAQCQAEVRLRANWCNSCPLLFSFAPCQSGPIQANRSKSSHKFAPSARYSFSCFRPRKPPPA